MSLQNEEHHQVNRDEDVVEGHDEHQAQEAVPAKPRSLGMNMRKTEPVDMQEGEREAIYRDKNGGHEATLPGT